MSDNNNKSCECFRFPNGTAMSASERAKQKANIQIFNNNKLLNCNNKLSTNNLSRRVYRGSQNKIRSVNGFKLTNQKCEENSNCIFNEKKNPYYWVHKNSNNDSRFTRITTNPSIEILIKGPLDKNILQNLAIETGNNEFLNPTEIIIGSEVTSISSDLLEDIPSINRRITTIGFKSLINKCVLIDNNAFRDCRQLQTLNIPNSVITIGNSAFENCLLLQIVTVPDSVTTIGKSAFRNCILLKTLTIGNSVSTIQENAFRECKVLQRLTLPDSVISIGKAAFRFCILLNTVTFGNSVETISEDAFRECRELTSLTLPTSLISIGPNIIFRTNITTINIPPNVTQIDEGAFACPTRSLLSITIDPTNSNFKILDNVLFNHNFTLLLCYPPGRTETEYTIPNTVTKIGRSSISNCTTLETINIPSSVTTIGEAAFFSNINLTNLNIPSSVTSFEVGFNFKSCTRLTTINIPNGVQFLGNSIFYGCFDLTTINIPSSVTTIGELIIVNTNISNINIPENVNNISEGAFISSSLTTITIDENNTNFRVVDNVLFNADRSLLLCYPANKQSSNYTIPNTVTRIGNIAFGSCLLETVELPDNLLSIGYYAFSFCENLTTINNISNSVRSIEVGAFIECKLLTSINIPTSLTTIEARTFEDCINLTTVIIPDNISYIGEYAFAYCQNITTINIPDSTEHIGKKAFYYNAITTIHIPANIKEIEDGAFNNPELDSITIALDNNNFKVEDNVLFNNDKSIILCYPSKRPGTSYDIPYSVTTISRTTFSKSYLQSINMGNNIILINNAAFENCTELTSITIPESLSFIGNFTFFACNSLTSIIIPSSVVHIDYEAFFDCYSLNSIIFNKAPINPIIDETAFDYTPFEDIIFYNDIQNFRRLIVDRTTENAVYSSALIVTFNNSSTHIIFPHSFNINEISNALPPGFTLTDIRDINVNPSINSFTQIDEFAFYPYIGESITIPSSVRKIGREAFRSSPLLLTVTFNKAPTNPIIESSAFDDTPFTNIIYFNNISVVDRTANNAIYSGLVTVTIYNLNTGNTEESIIAPTALSLIEFNEATNLSIGQGNLLNFSIDSGVNSFTTIGDNAFQGVVFEYADLIIPDSVRSIGNNAFNNCGLNSIEFPSSVRSIGNNAFEKCSILNTVTFKANIDTTIGTQVFTDTPVANVSVSGAGTPRGAPLNNLTGMTITDDNDVIYKA